MTHPQDLTISRPGDSADTAVVIRARNTTAGVAAEYSYLSGEFGHENVDWKIQSQMSTSQNRKTFDVLTVALKDGSSRRIWFDITAFYGKR